MRQLNYCSIMVGAVAGPGDLTDADRKGPENASRVASIASTLQIVVFGRIISV